MTRNSAAVADVVVVGSKRRSPRVGSASAAAPPPTVRAAPNTDADLTVSLGSHATTFPASPRMDYSAGGNDDKEVTCAVQRQSPSPGWRPVARVPWTSVVSTSNVFLVVAVLVLDGNVNWVWV